MWLHNMIPNLACQLTTGHIFLICFVEQNTLAVLILVFCFPSAKKHNNKYMSSSSTNTTAPTAQVITAVLVPTAFITQLPVLIVSLVLGGILIHFQFRKRVQPLHSRGCATLIALLLHMVVAIVFMVVAIFTLFYNKLEIPCYLAQDLVFPLTITMLTVYNVQFARYLLITKLQKMKAQYHMQVLKLGTPKYPILVDLDPQPRKFSEGVYITNPNALSAPTPAHQHAASAATPNELPAIAASFVSTPTALSAEPLPQQTASSQPTQPSSATVVPLNDSAKHNNNTNNAYSPAINTINLPPRPPPAVRKGSSFSASDAAKKHYSGASTSSSQGFYSRNSPFMLRFVRFISSNYSYLVCIVALLILYNVILWPIFMFKQTMDTTTGLYGFNMFSNNRCTSVTTYAGITMVMINILLGSIIILQLFISWVSTCCSNEQKMFAHKKDSAKNIQLQEIKNGTTVATTTVALASPVTPATPAGKVKSHKTLRYICIDSDPLWFQTEAVLVVVVNSIGITLTALGIIFLPFSSSYVPVIVLVCYTLPNMLVEPGFPLLLTIIRQIRKKRDQAHHTMSPKLAANTTATVPSQATPNARSSKRNSRADVYESLRYIFQQSEHLLNLFKAFAVKEFSVENVLCYSDILLYKTSDPAMRREVAERIFDLYLSTSSVLEVNITQDIKFAIKEKLGDTAAVILDANLFDDCETVISSNLLDTLSRFRKTRNIEEYLERHPEIPI